MMTDVSLSQLVVFSQSQTFQVNEYKALNVEFIIKLQSRINEILCNLCKFDVHDSVHLGNVYVRLKSPTRCTWIYMYSLFLYMFALHVSGAICTHPQEHKLQRYWLGHQGVPAST
jgi:hypothetical protein